MSRCFPFPPPGYEIKARPDNVDLILKEKQKLKKHKDKKDKDKKERSERKEKEKSEGKQKEGKDRKQKKHKDKKDKKKDKQRSSEEKKTVECLEDQKAEKLGPDRKPSNGVQDSRILVELGKRIRNDGGATDNQMVEKITLMEQRQANLHGKLPENNDCMLAEASNNIKDKRELSRMANGHILKVDARGSKNGFVGNFSGENQIQAEDGSSQVDKVEKKKEGKEKKEYGNGVGEGDARKNEGRDKKRKAEDKKRKKERKKEKKKEKEKVKEMSKENIKQRTNECNFLNLRDNNLSDHLKESLDSQGKIPKHREPLVNGFLHDNGFRPNNMSKAAISCHQVIQNGNGFHPSQSIVNLAVEKGAVITNQKVNGKLSSSPSMIENVRNVKSGQTAYNSTSEHRRASFNNHVVSNGLISSHLVGIERKTTPCQTTSNLTKVKQIVNNCSADDKCPSLESLVDSGRKMTGPKIDKAVDLKRPNVLHKMDNEELKMNGVLEGVEKYTSSRPSSASVKAKEKIGISTKKPPHPDLKYLSQILTVPTVDSPQFDDQDWLYGCRDSQGKRAKLASSQMEWTKQVWAKAIQVESEEVTAMPYVIPY